MENVRILVLINMCRLKINAFHVKLTIIALNVMPTIKRNVFIVLVQNLFLTTILVLMCAQMATSLMERIAILANLIVKFVIILIIAKNVIKDISWIRIMNVLILVLTVSLP
jgi:hypothetical protein